MLDKTSFDMLSEEQLALLNGSQKQKTGTGNSGSVGNAKRNGNGGDAPTSNGDA